MHFLFSVFLSLFTLFYFSSSDFCINICYATKEEVGIFFNQNTNLTIATIKNNNLNLEEKSAKLQKLFENTVDIEWMSRFAISKYWNRMDDNQKKNYLKIYKSYIINLYVPKFREYNDNSVTVTNIKAMDRNQYMVTTQVISANNKTYDISYRCKQYEDGSIKIIDIVGENISLISAQRSEFSSIIENNSIDYLISTISSKVNNNKK